MEMKDCPYCLSRIPAGAQKCKYCMEWLNKEKNNIQSHQAQILLTAREPSSDIPDSFSFQSKLVKKLPLHFSISYLLLSVLSFLVIQIVWYIIGEERVYLYSFSLYSLQMTVATAGIVWLEKLFRTFYGEIGELIKMPEKECKEYYLKASKMIFSPKRSFIAGVLISATAVIGDYFLDFPFNSNVAKATYALYEFFYFFWSGAALYIILRFATFVYDLGKLDLSIQLIHDSDSGLMHLGKLHLKTSLLAIVPLIFGILARSFFGHWNMGLATKLWFSLFGCVILIYILWPLYNIHVSMLKEKMHRLHWVAKEINNVFSVNRENFLPENLNRLSEILELEKHLKEMNSWPFEIKNVIALFSVVILPILSMFLDKFIKIAQSK